MDQRQIAEIVAAVVAQIDGGNDSLLDRTNPDNLRQDFGGEDNSDDDGQADPKAMSKAKHAEVKAAIAASKNADDVMAALALAENIPTTHNRPGNADDIQYLRLPTNRHDG